MAKFAGLILGSSLTASLTERAPPDKISIAIPQNKTNACSMVWF